MNVRIFLLQCTNTWAVWCTRSNHGEFTYCIDRKFYSYEVNWVIRTLYYKSMPASAVLHCNWYKKFRNLECFQLLRATLHCSSKHCRRLGLLTLGNFGICKGGFKFLTISSLQWLKLTQLTQTFTCLQPRHSPLLGSKIGPHRQGLWLGQSASAYTDLRDCC